MKRIDKLGAALFLIAIILCCAGAFVAQRTADLSRSVSARWPDGGVSPAQITEQEEYARQDGAQNRPEITLWNENRAAQLSDNGDRTAEAALIELFGNSEDICSEELLEGVFPARGDTEGCAISEKTAFDLWGSRDVLGKPILINGSIYSIRGVFKGNDGLALVQENGSSTKSFSHMQLRFPSGGSREEAEAFLLASGFNGAQFLDLPLLAWFVSSFAWIPVIALGLSVLIKLFRRGFKLRSFPLLLTSYMLPAVFIGASSLYLMGFPWSIPSRLIPTKWSDFELWQRIFDEIGKSMKAWLSADPSRIDISFWPSALLSVFLTILATALLVPAMRRVKIETGKNLVVGCLCTVGAMLLAVVLFIPSGGLKVGYNMWLIPWLWLGTDYVLYLHERNLKPKIGKEAANGTENQNAGLQTEIQQNER